VLKVLRLESKRPDGMKGREEYATREVEIASGKWILLDEKRSQEWEEKH
jgi:hypothetical protein